MASEALIVSSGNKIDTGLAASSIWRLVVRRAKVIVPINAQGCGPAFYCFHSVAGDVTGYYNLAERLGSEQKFYGIQVPKENMTASFAASVELMAQQYVKELVAFQPEGSFIVGGFSAGAIIALEVAQQLRALGRDVPVLVALDGAPSNSGAGLKPWNLRYVSRLARNLPRWLSSQDKQDWSFRQLVRRASNKFAYQPGTAIPSLRSAQTLHLNVVKSLFDRPGWQANQKSFMRAMYDAMHSYVPRPYDGRVLVYETRIQPLFHLPQIGAAWSKIAPRSEVVEIDGRHGNFFQRDSTLKPLAAHLCLALAALRRAPVESER